MVLLTKYSTEANKHVTVVNLPLVRFIGGPKNQGITGNIKGNLGHRNIGSYDHHGG